MNNIGARTLDAQFPIGSKVHIDGDKAIKGIVTGVLIYGYGTLYEVSWFSDNGHEVEKFDAFRLEEAQ